MKTEREETLHARDFALSSRSAAPLSTQRTHSRCSCARTLTFMMRLVN